MAVSMCPVTMQYFKSVRLTCKQTANGSLLNPKFFILYIRYILYTCLSIPVMDYKNDQKRIALLLESVPECNFTVGLVLK